MTAKPIPPVEVPDKTADGDKSWCEMLEIPVEVMTQALVEVLAGLAA